MPFTALHMAAAAPAKALLKHRFSVGLFAATQVVIDLEPLTAMVFELEPLHGYFHTFTGSLVAAALAAWLWHALAGVRLWRYTVKPIDLPWAVLTAWWGAWSHVWLDSLMHAEMASQRWVFGHTHTDVDGAHDRVLGLLGIGLAMALVTYAPEIWGAVRRRLQRR